MEYEGRVFRPPSEAFSLIVQSTVGCSHNKCDFCEMYREKTFHVRPVQDVLDDFSHARSRYGHVERIFIADGDALIRKTDDWVLILNHIRALFPECTRVSCYSSPKSLLLKSSDDLNTLRELGLGMVYLGIESGSDKVLQDMHKGESADSIVMAGIKAKDAGMKLSVTAISGLGGADLWEEHAIKTGEALSRMKPHFIGLLTLMLVESTPLYTRCEEGAFKVLGPRETAGETLIMLEHIDSEGSVFRSNHASNYLSLKGTLNGDKEQMMDVLRKAWNENAGYKDEWARGL